MTVEEPSNVSSTVDNDESTPSIPSEKPPCGLSSVPWAASFQRLLTSFHEGKTIREDSFYDRFFTTLQAYARLHPQTLLPFLAQALHPFPAWCHAKDPRVGLFGMRLCRLYLDLASQPPPAVAEEAEKEEDAVQAQATTVFEILQPCMKNIHETVQRVLSKEHDLLEPHFLLGTLEALESLPEAWEPLKDNERDRKTFFLTCLEHPSIHVVRGAWKALAKASESMQLELLDYLHHLLTSSHPSHPLAAAEWLCLQLEAHRVLPGVPFLRLFAPYFTSPCHWLRRKLLSVYALDTSFYLPCPALHPTRLMHALVAHGYLDDTLLVLPRVPATAWVDMARCLDHAGVAPASLLAALARLPASFATPATATATPPPPPATASQSLLDWILHRSLTCPPWAWHGLYLQYRTLGPPSQAALRALIDHFLPQPLSPRHLHDVLRAIDVAQLASHFPTPLAELQHHDDESIVAYATRLLQQPQHPVPSHGDSDNDDDDNDAPGHTRSPADDLEDLLQSFDYHFGRQTHYPKASSHDCDHDDHDDDDEASWASSENDLDCYV